MTSKPMPGFYFSSTSRQVFPVWKGSTRNEVKFAPVSKRQAAKLYHDARRFERSTRTKGRQDGKLGRNGLLILHAMLFDCINFVSGQLDPSYAGLARLANISMRSVARGLVKLKAAGVINWIRRCTWRDDGTLEQDTNAYAVISQNQWHGFTPSTPPAPDRGTWGDYPPIPSPLEQAAAAIAAGDRQQAQAALELEPGGLAGALATLGRSRTNRPGS